MEMSQVHDLVATIGAHPPGCADIGVLRARLADIRRLSAWLESRRLIISRDLAAVSSFPENDIAQASQTSLRDAARLVERAEAVADSPPIEVALAVGELTAGHIDIVTAECAKLSGVEKRAEFMACADRFVMLARTATLEQFRSFVVRERSRIDAGDGSELFKRQARAARLRTWNDKRTGMWHLSGAFDPLTGAQIEQQLERTMRRLFAERTPEGAPTDAGEKQDFLRAHALMSLLIEGPSERGPGDRKSSLWSTNE